MKCGCVQPNGGIGGIQFPGGLACGLHGPVKDTPLVDRIDVANRAQLNQVVSVKLEGAAAKDAQGRHVLVTGFELEAVVRVVTTDTTNGAVPAYNLLSKFSNVFLADNTGFQYLAGVSGCDLMDDVFMRNHRLPEYGYGGSNGVQANVGTAQNNDIRVKMFFPFVRMDPMNPSLRGAILLSSLQARGADALKFTVADFTAQAGAITNITDGGFQGTIYVRLHTVALKDPMVYAPWQLESYQHQPTSGILRHPDRMHEYLYIRPRGYETADLTGYSGVTVEVGNKTYIPALTAAELEARTLSELNGDMLAIGSDLYGASSITTGTDLFPALAFLPRSRTNAGMAAGPINFNFTARTDQTTRYLHRTVVCQSKARASKMSDDCGCDPRRYIALPVNDQGRPTTLAQDPAAGLALIRG